MASGFPSLHTLSLSLVALHKQSCLMDLFTEKSFPRLKKLSLDSCLQMKQLKVSCRALKELVIENCFQLHGLDISCLVLEDLRVENCFEVYNPKSWIKVKAPCLRILSWKHNQVAGIICLENLTSLDEAFISFPILYEDGSTQKFHSVYNFLAGLCHARALTLETQCIEILSNKKCFGSFYLFDKLKVLELHTGFNKNNVSGLAFLFGSCPILHTLILRIVNDLKIERKMWSKDIWDPSTSKEEQYWESKIQILKPFLDHIKVVKIHGFLDCENEVSLVKFLLKHGKDLEEMTLCTADCNYRDLLRRQKVRSQMMGFSWASSNAKLAFY
ncbi:hypothetical protein Tsubulata_038614 [Turnera subulata]|uniref:FBD domain-containing protein n=1 Tax=Turnera subulata TaxID=218843 RepID=A0A9Q0FG69_9ROSI|nr:hypothetical protein Tsubulata_038614 [Turnera subulata]